MECHSLRSSDTDRLLYLRNSGRNWILKREIIWSELEGKAIVLRPKVLMDREDAIKALHQIMSDVQSRTGDVDPEVIEREVAEAIREVRKQKRHAKSRA